VRRRAEKEVVPDHASELKIVLVRIQQKSITGYVGKEQLGFLLGI
jgi:hypothetical protein